MKTLLVLRHAKSSWKDVGMLDFDRPLNKRGNRAAPLIGRLIAQQELVPEIILCSTAMRTRQTAELVAQHCGFGGEIHFVDDLYLAPPTTLLTYIRQVPDSISRAMVVGHNPGMEELVRVLTGRDERMPTAALARIHLPVDSWSLVLSEGVSKLVELWRPRDFESSGPE